jgi:hypothetical protein
MKITGECTDSDILKMLKMGDKAPSPVERGVMCEDCAWVNNFTPRQDEIDRGLSLGCKKPGWEGYTENEKPLCGGVFFTKKST